MSHKEDNVASTSKGIMIFLFILMIILIIGANMMAGDDDDASAASSPVAETIKPVEKLKLASEPAPVPDPNPVLAVPTLAASEQAAPTQVAPTPAAPTLAAPVPATPASAAPTPAAPTPTTPTLVAPTVTASAEGKATYTAACVACHGSGAAGAPKLGDKAAWVERIAQGMGIMEDHAIKGYQGKKGFMPAKGGRADLSDTAVKAAVAYIVSESK